jgi:hypothetical protein
MKKIIVSLLALFAMVNISLAAEKTVLEQASNAAKQVVSTNINQVMVQILTGVKDASGEIYGASKFAVTEGYEVMKKETPEVIKEFLRWRVVEAVIYIGVLSLLAIILFIFAHYLKVYADKKTYHQDEANGFKWFLRVVACAIIVISLGVNGMTIGKVVAAPRVYIIEYVVDTINTHQANHR